MGRDSKAMTINTTAVTKRKEETKPAREVFPSELDRAISRCRGGIPEGVEERWDYAAHNLRQSLETMVNAGKALVTLKADLQHGQFIEACNDRGIHRNTARNLMGVALAFGDDLDHLKKLSISKLYALSAAGISNENFNPELNAFLLPGEEGAETTLHIDEVSKMPVDQLRKSLRKEKDKNAALMRREADAEVAIAKLERKLHPIPNKFEEAIKVCADVRTEATAAIRGVDRIRLDDTTEGPILREAVFSVASIATEAVIKLQSLLTHENVKTYAYLDGIDTKHVSDFLFDLGAVTRDKLGDIDYSSAVDSEGAGDEQ